MIKLFGAKIISVKELTFRILLSVVVFIFYAYDKKSEQIEFHELVNFLNYAIVAFFINFIFLPKYYYKKKYLHFTISLTLITALAIILEEYVLEKIFYPDTRGMNFSNVFFTLVKGMPVVVILTGFKFAWDALLKQREVDNLKAAVKESELQFLKSQINPHFLFNNLNNLYAYAIENSPKTPDIILELSSVLRYMLYECREKYVPLAKEIDLVENFMRLNELQVEDRGKVKFEKHNIKPEFKIAPLILIVFIENAYKHSTASLTKDISIDVFINLNPKGELEFTCKNSYQPESNTDNLAKGIGLENVKKRLQLMYPHSHDLKITQNNGIYEVFLSVNLTKTE